MHLRYIIIQKANSKGCYELLIELAFYFLEVFSYFNKMISDVIKFNKTIRFKIKNALHFDFTILKKIMFIGLPFAADLLFFTRSLNHFV